MKGALDLDNYDLSDRLVESILDNHSTARFLLDDSVVSTHLCIIQYVCVCLCLC